MRPILLVPLAGLLAGCAPAPVTAPPAAARPSQVSCDASEDADFAGPGEEQLRGYVAWLAETHGRPVALEARQVSFSIVRGAAKPAPFGVQGAEIACDGDEYRITIYRDALAGRPRAMTYKVIAHEFYHLVQIRRDRLDCAASKGNREGYEREADEFAAKVVPACVR